MDDEADETYEEAPTQNRITRSACASPTTNRADDVGDLATAREATALKEVNGARARTSGVSTAGAYQPYEDDGEESNDVLRTRRRLVERMLRKPASESMEVPETRPYTTTAKHGRVDEHGGSERPFYVISNGENLGDGKAQMALKMQALRIATKKAGARMAGGARSNDVSTEAESEAGDNFESKKSNGIAVHNDADENTIEQIRMYIQKEVEQEEAKRRERASERSRSARRARRSSRRSWR